MQSVGYKVPFEYGSINGEILIDGYYNDNGVPKIALRYNTNRLVYTVGAFRDHNIKKLFGTYKQKYKIGEIVNAKNSAFKILGVSVIRCKNQTGKKNGIRYEVMCLKCGYIYRKSQYGFENTGCKCCSGFELVQGINDISTTNPEMIPYFQGGYDEAKNYTRSSQKKIIPVCPNCGRIHEKEISICHLYEHLRNGQNGFKCICSDGISFPEKFVFSFLEQLNIEFETQKFSKELFGYDNRFYDFYIKDFDCIIEAHGMQHYQEVTFTNMTLEEIQNNDDYKMKLAKSNNIGYYIILDCRYSDKSWIKNSIMNSDLQKIFNISDDDIDWNYCLDFAVKNIAKEVCNDYRNGAMIKELQKKYKLGQYAISSYLKIGNDVGWCKYSSKINKYHFKPINMYKDGVYIKSFKGINETIDQSKEIFGAIVSNNDIKRSIVDSTPYRGFTFEYVTNPHEREVILYGDS